MTIKERPILFSGPMVQAILDGRKTQTRRVCRPQPTSVQWKLAHSGNGVCVPHAEKDGMYKVRCYQGGPGDHLWVRETFLYRAQKTAVLYRADLDDFKAAGIGAMYGGWKPSIFMPRKWSRITLEITEVRVERLHELTEKDAIYEGVEKLRREKFKDYWYRNYGKPCLMNGTGMPLHYFEARDSFQSLWDSINSKRGFDWASNPWVWVIAFKRL